MLSRSTNSLINGALVGLWNDIDLVSKGFFRNKTLIIKSLMYADYDHPF